MKKILVFKRQNCSNCKKMEEVIKNISSDITVEYIDADTNKDTLAKYQPTNPNWQLPLIVCFENEQVMNITTGIVTRELIELCYRPLIEIEALSFRAIRGVKMMKKQIGQSETLLKYLGFILQAKESKSQPKQQLDLSGFPEGQNPEDEGCDGCGNSNQ